MTVALADLTASFAIKGASVPIDDGATGSSRTLTDLGTISTPPRAASYSGLRGAEFRTSSFSASSPQAFGCATATGINTSLYVSSKIQTFTWLARFRPSKSGLTSIALTPIGGLYSATNLGATPNVYNQPCFVHIRQTAGASRVIVSVMGAILDTTIATQSSGAASTAPSDDLAWQTIGVIVTGDSTTNNTVHAVQLVHVTASGTRRVYDLGAHRAAAQLTFSTNPADTKVVVINGRTYTFKTALAGTAAVGTFAGTGTNVADGETVVVGPKTYTFKTSVTPAAKATAQINFNAAKTVSKSDKQVDITVGGFALHFISGTGSTGVSGGSYPAGSIKGYSTAIDLAAEAVHNAIHGDDAGNTKLFRTPSSPTTGSNAGKDWDLTSANARDFWTKFSLHSSDTANTVTLEAVVAGTAGNAITLAYTDTNTTKVISSVSGATFSGGTDAPVAYSVKIGANWAATKANLIAAINHGAGSGTVYSADITVANTVAVASDPGGNDITLTSLLTGTAGNGQALSDTSAQITTTAFATGADGADTDNILIGATAAVTMQHFVDCLNLTGSKGFDYSGSAATVVNADVTASLGLAGIILLVAKAAGTSGNAVTLTSDVANLTVKDEFGDKTQTTLVGGTAAPPFVAAAGARPDNYDLRILVGGYVDSFTATAGIFDGAASDVALANRALTVDEIAEWGFQPPAASTRDRGWYRAAHKVRIAAKSDLTSTWHVPIALATGALSPRVELQRYGSRFAFRLISVGGAGRPMECNAFAFSYQREGGVNPAARGGYFDFPDFKGGITPNIGKPLVPHDSMYDAVNMSLHQGVLKTRRGYRILASAGTSVAGTPCAFYDCTNASGNTWHLYFAGGTIYQYDNGNLTSLDTGWPVNELPTSATVGQKTFFLSSARKRVFIDGTFYDVGVTAPVYAPTLGIPTALAGGPIATAPGYEYVYTYRNNVKLTDSGPSPSLVVVLPPGTPASSIPMGFTASAGSDVNFWRRKIGNTDNVFLFVGTVLDGAGTTFTDTSEQPGIETLDDFGGLAVTADFPDGTACAVYAGKLLVWGLADNRQVAISEQGDGERWWGGSILTLDGAVRGAIASEGRALLYTDKTVESVEGDFLRSPSGEIGVTRHVLDPSSGSFGAFAQCVAGGRVFWADANGIHTMQNGLIYRDVSAGISWPVTPIVQNAVDTSGTSVVLEYDYVSGQLWCCLTQSDSTDQTRNRIVLSLDLDKRKWTKYDHPLSHLARVRDGIYGYFFVGCDYYGNVMEMDVYDADGIQGNESWMTGIALSGVFTSCDVSAKTITFTGMSFPTSGSGLRGVSIVCEDVSAGEFTRQTILSNTATILTLDGIPSALVAGDKAYIGQIYGMLETPEVDAGTQDKKTLREAAIGLVNCTEAAY